MKDGGKYEKAKPRPARRGFAHLVLQTLELAILRYCFRQAGAMVSEPIFAANIDGALYLFSLLRRWWHP
jgi:hypothetical protein